ncbi:hypothetical protein ACFRCG_03230 [Embleya sp. NPDC056575]|uniref:hypothetical protein n=1 Tax=unclassified Embleya TaxID=2699296 RepID=UPI0036B3E9C5
MPALNIDFTDEELAELRETAKARGVTLKSLVHEAVTEDLAQRRALASMTAVLRAFAAEHTAAFDDAFPDDAPTGARRRGAA